MIYLLDTNIFLRVLIREDEKSYEECVAVLKRIKRQEIKAMTAGIVLAEAVWVLKSVYKLQNDETSEKVAGIIKLGGLKIIDKYDWAGALQVYGSNKVKFIDAVLATISQVAQKKWIIVSYDDDFGKLDIEWVRPGEMI